MKAESAPRTELIKKEFIPSNRITRVSHKLVKEEPSIRLVHRKEKLMGPERIIHPSGKLCKKSNRGGYYDDELPDLPAVPAVPAVPARVPESRSGQTLNSPPAVRPSTIQQTHQVSDVLSGYILDHQSRTVATQREPHRVVQTLQAALPQNKEPRPRYQSLQTSHREQTVSDILSGYIPKGNRIRPNATQCTDEIPSKTS